MDSVMYKLSVRYTTNRSCDTFQPMRKPQIRKTATGKVYSNSNHIGLSSEISITFQLETKEIQFDIEISYKKVDYLEV